MKGAMDFKHVRLLTTSTVKSTRIRAEKKVLEHSCAVAEKGAAGEGGGRVDGKDGHAAAVLLDGVQTVRLQERALSSARRDQ